MIEIEGDSWPLAVMVVAGIAFFAFVAWLEVGRQDKAVAMPVQCIKGTLYGLHDDKYKPLLDPATMQPQLCGAER